VPIDFQTLRQDVEDTLSRALAGDGLIAEAKRHAVLGGGKRLRPLMLLSAAEAIGAIPRDFLEAAAAVEIIHAASLILDDLPSMDDAQMRRGRPTIHKAYGEAAAILGAVSLVGDAFHLIASNGARLRTGSGQVARACELASHTIGAIGMSGGQAIDLEASRRVLRQSELLQCYYSKTGSLFALSAMLPPVLADSPSDQLESLRRYGLEFGLAFQLADDLRDPVETTKDRNKDRNKHTLAAQLGSAEANARKKKATEAALAALDIFGERAASLSELARRALA